MFGLVAFHSTFNLIGLLIFLPILKYYTRWIQRMLPVKAVARSEYFDVPVEVADAAVDSLAKARRHLGSDALNLSWQGIELNTDRVVSSAPLSEFGAFNTTDDSYEHNYERLKAFEGDLLRYAGKLGHTRLSTEQELRVANLVESARSLVYASKTLKDIRADFLQLHLAAGNALAVELYESHVEFMGAFFTELIPLFFSAHRKDYLTEQIDVLSGLNNAHHQSANDLITKHLSGDGEIIGRLSTWFNLNHELHHYARYMLDAVVNETQA